MENTEIKEEIEGTFVSDKLEGIAIATFHQTIEIRQYYQGQLHGWSTIYVGPRIMNQHYENDMRGKSYTTNPHPEKIFFSKEGKPLKALLSTPEDIN